MPTEVIVAGAGPVGLLSAALLDTAGVRVEVVDPLPQPTPYSRGTTMHPRTLETLTGVTTSDGLSIAEHLVRRGRPIPRAHFATLPSTLDYSTLDTPYPFVLMIPQAETERMLAEQLDHQQVAVRRGVAVTGFEQDTDGIRVEFSDGSTRDAAFLLGADGAHSTVRSAAGIGFPGTAPDEVGFAADVHLDSPPATPSFGFAVRVGSAAVIPLGNGAHRVFGVHAHDTGLTPDEARRRREEPLTTDEVRATLIAVHGTDFGLRDASWLARSGNSTRHADTYRSGRVVVAGDAAHVHLPAGGQGLNIGLQDAANLAWKLAAEIRGTAPRAIIDGPASYDRERRPIAEKLAANTRAQNALMTTFTEAGAALRDLVSGFIARDGAVAADLAGWLSGLGHAYPAGDGADRLHGTRAPDLVTAQGNLLRLLGQGKFIALDFTPDHSFAPLARENVVVTTADPAWNGVHGALIRPDGYVAAVTQRGPAELDRAAADWITAAPRSAPSFT